MFHLWMESGHQFPEGAEQFMPPAATVPAKNILRIKKTVKGPELTFLNQFTAGMDSAEAATARLLYHARSQGHRVEDIAGHEKLPKGFKYLHQLRPLSTRLSKAAEEFDRQTGNNVWSKIKPNRSGERAIRQVYIEEPEHHAGIESFMRDKLSREGASPPLMKILTQTMMGRVMPARLSEDPELLDLAQKKYQADIAKWGKSAGRRPGNAKALVNNYRQRFKDWLPEYFESAGRPDLAQKYQDKAAAIESKGQERWASAQGTIPRQTAEQRKLSRRGAAVTSHEAYKAQKQSQKQAIDRDSLNLSALPEAFQAHFSRTGKGHDQRQVDLAAERTKLAMIVVREKLEGRSLPEIVERPEVQQLTRLPGFFRSGTVNRTSEQNRAAVQSWWSKSVLEAVQKVSPVLHDLLTENYKKFRATYHPLSQTPEFIEPE